MLTSNYFHTIKVYSYFHHELKKKINPFLEQGYKVVEYGFVNSDGTKCWVILRIKRLPVFQF